MVTAKRAFRGIHLLVALLTLVAGACTLLLPFDPEGQPCAESLTCAEGYGCDGTVCRKDTTPGSAECKPDGCRRGTRCSLLTQKCVADTCATRQCEAGSACTDVPDAGSKCTPILAPALGHACANNDCSNGGTTPNRVCYRSGIQTDVSTTGGKLRPGICVETCSTPGAPCLTDGGVCTDIDLPLGGGKARLCMPQNQLPKCKTNADCLEDGLVCTVFDHPSVGPTTLCASPLPGGAGLNEACSILSTDGGAKNLCANGLCLPKSSSGGHQRCGEPCSEGTCGARSCQLSEFDVSGVIRHVPICVDRATYCQTCPTGAGLCEPDAPNCVDVSGIARCLSSCSPDAGTPCPPGQACSVVGGVFRCVAPTGTCP